MVKPIREFIQIQGQIFGRNLMINAGDRPLEQGPDIFNPVNMDFPGLHIGFLMVHGIMDKLRGIEPPIGLKLIGMNFGPRRGVFADESRQGADLHIINRLHEDFA